MQTQNHFASQPGKRPEAGAAAGAVPKKPPPTLPEAERAAAWRLSHPVAKKAPPPLPEADGSAVPPRALLRRLKAAEAGAHPPARSVSAKAALPAAMEGKAPPAALPRKPPPPAVQAPAESSAVPPPVLRRLEAGAHPPARSVSAKAALPAAMDPFLEGKAPPAALLRKPPPLAVRRRPPRSPVPAGEWEVEERELHHHLQERQEREQLLDILLQDLQEHERPRRALQLQQQQQEQQADQQEQLDQQEGEATAEAPAWQGGFYASASTPGVEELGRLASVSAPPEAEVEVKEEVKEEEEHPWSQMAREWEVGRGSRT